MPSIDIVVNTSGLNKGMITLSVSSSLIKILPISATGIIKEKVEGMTHEDNQKKVIKYFNELSSKSYRHNVIQGISDGIMIDAYNMRTSGSGMIFRAGASLSPLNDYSVIIYIITAFIFIMPIYMLKRSNDRDKKGDT